MESSSISSATGSALQHPAVIITPPQATRRILDSFHHRGFGVSLSYQEKSLVVELFGPDSEQPLGSWTFCAAKPNNRRFVGESSQIRVSYRPASVEFRFEELGNVGLMKRLFSASLKSQDAEISFQLCSNGSVLVQQNVAGRESSYCVR